MRMRVDANRTDERSIDAPSETIRGTKLLRRAVIPRGAVKRESGPEARNFDIKRTRNQISDEYCPRPAHGLTNLTNRILFTLDHRKSARARPRRPAPPSAASYAIKFHVGSRAYIRRTS